MTLLIGAGRLGGAFLQGWRTAGAFPGTTEAALQVLLGDGGSSRCASRWPPPCGGRRNSPGPERFPL